MKSLPVESSFLHMYRPNKIVKYNTWIAFEGIRSIGTLFSNSVRDSVGFLAF